MKADYAAHSHALVRPQGGLSVSLTDVGANTATSDITVEAYAGLTGEGSLYAGALKVLAEGALESIAEAQTAEINVSIARFATNCANAVSRAVQTAQIDNAGTIEVAGDVEILSEFANSSAQATTGASSAKEVSLISGSDNKAVSTLNEQSTARLAGSGLLTSAGSVKVLA